MWGSDRHPSMVVVCGVVGKTAWANNHSFIPQIADCVRMTVRHFNVIHPNSGVCFLTADTGGSTFLRRWVTLTRALVGLSTVALSVLDSFQLFGRQR